MTTVVRPAAIAFVLLAACASSTRQDEPAENNASPIVNGTVDTTRTAVVAVLGTDFSCSGTIISAAASQGTVLTAASCCKAGDLPTEIVLGNDYNSGQAKTIVPGSIWVNADFDPVSPNASTDFCVFQVTGTALPAIPLTSAPDDVGVGTAATIVGYGNTANPPAGVNTKRRQTSIAVDAVTSTTIHWTQPDAGACEGDHGGPVLFTSGTGESVVGVMAVPGGVECVPGSETAARITGSLGDTGFLGAYLAAHPFGRHELGDGGVEIIADPDAGSDAGSISGGDGGSLGGGDSGTSSGGNDAGASTTRSDGGASDNAGGANDGGGCSTSGANDDASTGALLGLAIGAAFIAKRRRAKR